MGGQSMSSQFRNQAGTKSPKGVSVINFSMELFGQLSVDSFDDLSDTIKEFANRFRQLLLLVAARNGEQSQAVFAPETRNQVSTDESFVANHIQISMLDQHFFPNDPVMSISV